MDSIPLSGRLVFLCLVFAAGCLSCEEEPSAPPPPDSPVYTVETRVIRDIDFIRNKYFWINDPEFGGLAGDPGHLTVAIDVWREITPADKFDQPDMYWMPGKVFYDQNGDGSALDIAAGEILNGNKPSAAYIQQDFKRLELGRDFRLIQDFDTKGVVGIELAQSIREDRALAVNYISVQDDRFAGSPFVVGGPYSQYGIPIGSGAERDTMILELIKAKYPRPDSEFGPTWGYMMRNFYNLGLNYIAPAYTDIEIHDNTPRLDTTHPTGSNVPYIRIFGFDQQNRAFEPVPDGKFDMPSIYIDLSRGILQFPYAWGFAPSPDSVSRWTDGLFSFEDSSFVDQHAKSAWMYTKHLTNPFVEAYQYDIVVRVRHYE